MVFGVCTGPVFALSSSPLQYKSFISGPSLWLSDPTGILMYRGDSRIVRGVMLSDSVENDSIFDIAENSKTLWVLAKSGVYQIDYGTTTVEKLPGQKKGGSSGKLAVDDDYVWITTGDTLWRFDKLGREWFHYDINGPAGALCGMYSNGTNVYLVLGSSVKIFSIQEEKWLEFPYKKGMPIGPQARFFLDKNALVVVDGPTIYRYIISSLSWVVIPAEGPVIDMLNQDTTIFYQTASGIFEYFTATSVSRPLDIPGVSAVRCFARQGDTIYCATDDNFIKYDIVKKTTDNIERPQTIADYSVLKSIILGGTLVILCPKNMASYDRSTRIWETLNLSGTGNKKRTVIWDDDHGLQMHMGKGMDSQLKGSVQKDYIVDSLINRNDSTVLSYTDPVPRASLTLHNTFSKGRYLDAFFDNSDLSMVANKGLFYRGAASDNIESARLGTNTVDMVQTKTLPASQYQGGSAVLQSRSSLSTRDRRIIKAKAGAGLITTKTQYNVLPYTESGIYSIRNTAGDSTRKNTLIVPGSLKVSIDGEDIDSSYFSFVALTGALKFNRDDLLDPTSVIKISYQVQAVPDSGIDNVEFVPKNHFGKLGYASVAVSPVDWISPEAGFFYVHSDSMHSMVNIALPAEIRSSSPSLFLKISPDITWDAAASKKAAGLSVQSRFGDKLSMLMNGLLPDSGFVTTNSLDQGYGGLKHDADFTVSYDIKKELPISYFQRDIASAGGSERRYEFTAGSHFLGMPFCDVSLSRNVVDAHRIDTMALVKIDSALTGTGMHIDTTKTDSISYDTLNRIKDKYRIRLYETSSPYVESALHINRLNYDFSYTGFFSRKEHEDGTGYGNLFYGNWTISPIKKITLSGTGTYLKNPAGSLYSREYNPTVILQTIDFPMGVDIAARNDLAFKSSSDSNSSTCTINRAVNLTLKPGSWTKYLGWISPLLGINQSILCNFKEASPGFGALLSGNTDVASNSFTKSLGANIFPTNEITIQDNNQWTTADSSTKYHTLNDVKWWFGSRRLWQTRWEYDRDRPRFSQGHSRDFHRGFTQFTDSWTPWLQTITGVSSSYVLTDSAKTPRAGPDITVSISKQKFLCFKTLLNNHTLNLAWGKENDTVQSAPDISYSFYLKVIIIPNISIITNDAFTFSKGAFTKYNGMISAALLF
jgi:hypothetical protein